ncbi:unnamed protein product [Rangifer tarandus platyrhynchus]|uniref:Uncharacterized protein n=3 Tax=Rangifer tarandus platyrhynchus TaxID=3082113 RepID=A0ABN8XQB9_RANTA|nr:unnamed protein product [Rangifer tarandus platyrhynchus]CAI9150408.1 unnamed protein product [Rangifer tarandus platyrhynchus]
MHFLKIQLLYHVFYQHICLFSLHHPKQSLGRNFFFSLKRKSAEVLTYFIHLKGFPGGSDGKESICKEPRRPGFDPWVGKDPWRRDGNPLQYSYLENPPPWTEKPIVHGVARSQTQLGVHTHTHLKNRTVQKG